MTKTVVEIEESALDVALGALHHIDTMYPGMWNGVPKTARLSLKNHLVNAMKVAFSYAVEPTVCPSCEAIQRAYEEVPPEQR